MEDIEPFGGGGSGGGRENLAVLQPYTIAIIAKPYEGFALGRRDAITGAIIANPYESNTQGAIIARVDPSAIYQDFAMAREAMKTWYNIDSTAPIYESGIAIARKNGMAGA